MPKTIQTLIQICLFRAKPQDLGASVTVLVVAIIATFVLFMVRNYYLIASPDILAISLAQTGLLGIGLRILLALTSKSSRWLQSATALYGCCGLILLAIILCIMLFNGASAGNLLLMQFAVIGFGLWFFVVIVYIIRETLEIGNVPAFFITLALELFFTITLLVLFGAQL